MYLCISTGEKCSFFRMIPEWDVSSLSTNFTKWLPFCRIGALRVKNDKKVSRNKGVFVILSRIYDEKFLEKFFAKDSIIYVWQGTKYAAGEATIHLVRTQNSQKTKNLVFRKILRTY